MADNRNIISGADELARYASKLPPEAAKRLQFIVRKNFRDHQAEVVRSSTFKHIQRASLRGLIRPWPKSVTDRSKISEVRGGTDVYWKGLGTTDPAQGVAARIEKRVGQAVNRPLRKQFLLIPQGDMLKNGKPRRVADGGMLKQVAVRNIVNSGRHMENRLVGHKNVPILQSGTLEGTAVIKTKRGLRLIQKLEAKKRGKFEQVASGPDGIKVRSTRLGERFRVIGLLKRTAKQAQPLDFFDSWDRLATARDERYQRLLDDLAKVK